MTSKSESDLKGPYKGRCCCGEIEFEWSGSSDPAFSCFCHCRICRGNNSTPAQHLLGVKQDEFKITKGECAKYAIPQLDGSAGKCTSNFCKTCGAGIYQDPVGAPFVGTFPCRYDAFSPPFPKDKLPQKWLPNAHVNFENAIEPAVFANDGLPKFKDFPKEMGGSGEMCENPDANRAECKGQGPFEGACACGDIEFEWSNKSDPVGSALCHCRVCRGYNSTQAQHVFIVKADDFKITKGECSTYVAPKLDGSAGTFSGYFCKKCGVPVYQGPNGVPFFGTFPGRYKAFSVGFPKEKLPESWQPKFHLNCENAILLTAYAKDGLPKFKDTPKEMGGSGELL